MHDIKQLKDIKRRTRFNNSKCATFFFGGGSFAPPNSALHSLFKKLNLLCKNGDVDMIEMKAFIGLIFLMGVVHKSSAPMYWLTEGLYHTPLSTDMEVFLL